LQVHPEAWLCRGRDNLPQAAVYASAQKVNPYVFFSSGVKYGIGDAQLTADFRHARIHFSLFQGKDNLLFGES